MENKVSIRAAWILERICTHHDLDEMVPYFNEFSAHISTLKFDNAIRPFAKICEHLATAFYSCKENEFKKALKNSQIDSIVTCAFDWFITPQKIATQVYTIHTLYLFGLQKD